MAAIPSTEAKLKVSPKVSWGFISYGGIVLAAGQYMTALGNALSAGEINSGSIGLIVTATATFLAVAAGRYKQASDVIKGISGERVANPMSVLTPNELTELSPETNVLYLDGKELATAIVKALNTNALIQGMRIPESTKTTTPGNTSISGEETS